VPADARFCPRCAAPVDAAIRSEAPAVLEARRPRWERLLFAGAVLVLVASVVLAVLVIAFGVFVDSSAP